MATIRYVKGDATQPQAKGNRIIAHVCNDLGGWGKGFVLAISKRWPGPEAAYRAWHKDRSKNDFGLGAIQIVQVEPYIWVANMVAQRGMKTGSNGPPIRYEAVRACLKKLAVEAERVGGERPHAPDRLRPGRRAVGGDRTDHPRRIDLAGDRGDGLRFCLSRPGARLHEKAPCRSTSL